MQEVQPDSDGMNLATVWEAVAAAVPSAPALIHTTLTRTWAEFEDRAARLAAYLIGAGLGPGSNVALYLYNGPEYLESTFGAFKLRAATLNVNYRYLEDELKYLFENSQAEAVVFAAEFSDRIDAVRDSLPLLTTFVCVGATEEHHVPEWASDYEKVIEQTAPMPAISRSGDDLWLLYTGGTTGNPKGVMWPHRSLLGTAKTTFAVVDCPIPETAEQVAVGVRRFHERSKAVRFLPAAPLMHGTSAIASIAVLSVGGCVVTLDSHSFNGDELCEAVQNNAVTQLTIVGDAFAKPILAALEKAQAAGTPYDISSLKVILSSGVMWSQQTKDQILEWCGATLADTLGSSEGVGFANSVAKRNQPAQTARFTLGEHARVIDDDGQDVVPGSGQRGLLAVGGPIPIGYFRDPVKTAATFRKLNGQIWSVPGDFATVESDGTIQLLGRGSACINTAGEKVYPEEVEEALKLHPAVLDANVLGLPDEKWGQSVNAVVSLREVGEGSALPTPQELIEFTKSRLAGYKCPKRVLVVDQVHRGPNGKPDYKWASAELLS